MNLITTLVQRRIGKAFERDTDDTTIGRTKLLRNQHGESPPAGYKSNRFVQAFFGQRWIVLDALTHNSVFDRLAILFIATHNSGGFLMKFRVRYTFGHVIFP